VPRRAAGAPALSGGLVVHLQPGSRARAIYGRDRIEAHYSCNFELNPDYHETLERAGLRTAGVGPAGEVRAVELPRHPFYVATLYQPQRSSRPDAPDPLVSAFARAAHAFRQQRLKGETTS